MSPLSGSSANLEPKVCLSEADQHAEWVQRIAAGDAQAFEMLFRSLYDRLCVFAESYIASPHAAEEIVDDVFLNLWKGRERLRIRTSVLSYLFVAVRNKALTYCRRARIERRYVERAATAEGAGAVNGSGEIEERVALNELMLYLKEAVDELPPRARQAYQLYYRQHLSYADIARVMGISIKTVENQLSRALKTLLLRLKGRLT